MNTASKNDKSKLSKLLKEKARTRRIVIVLVCFLALSVAFVCGFALRSQVSLMESLGVNIGLDSSSARTGSLSSSEATSKTSVKSVYNSISKRIDEVEDILSSNSFYSPDLDKATQQSINSILASTGDPYAKYFNAQDYSKLIEESKSNQYAGAGFTLNEMNGKCYIADVFDNSEASVKGVKTGDYIKSINGVSQIGKSAVEVTNEISNNSGKSIVATFVHPLSSYGDTGEEYTVNLSISNQDVQNVTSSVSEGLAYVNIHQFNDETESVLSALVKELDNDDVSAFVIDVRSNPGGYLSGALDSSALFLNSGTLVTIETTEGNSDRTTEGQTITSKPIVLIVDSNTSAAAEVFVASLHDNNRAAVVGHKTAGKGTVAAMRELTFGGAVRYTAARYITPSGNYIQDNGISPDIEVSDVSGLSYDDSTLSSAIDSAVGIASR